MAELVQQPISQLVEAKMASDKRPLRQRSCPPMVSRSVTSGPWSLEWLKDHVHCAAGVVSSSKHASNRNLSIQPKVVSKAVDCISNFKKVKVGGRLKHTAHNLKKIARLPDHGRNKVLKIPMKKRRRTTVNLVDALPDSIPKGPQLSDASSSTFVNNDWKNWVVLHGKEDVVKNDIQDFGKALGVKFYNDKNNHFRLLSRGRKQNKELVGGPKMATQTV